MPLDFHRDKSFLAPLHSYTDLPFRLLCQKYGARATCVPLINATALVRNRACISEVDAHPDERNVGVQLVSDSVEDIVSAASLVAKSKPFISYLNINCGCPSLRVIQSGGGSALLKTPEKIVAMVDGIKKKLNFSDIQLSVKIRIRKNVDGSKSGTLELCKSLESAGVDFIVIHARLPTRGYASKPDLEIVRAVADATSIPIIANGDIRSNSEGAALVKNRYCSGFMIGRTAMSNPMCFSDRTPKTLEARFALLSEYISISKEYQDCLGPDSPSLNDVKIKALQLVSDIPGAASIRNAIAHAKSVDDVFKSSKNQ